MPTKSESVSTKLSAKSRTHQARNRLIIPILLAIPIAIRLLPVFNREVTVDEILPILSIVIVIVAMISFVLELVPIAITAVASAVLMSVTGVLKFEDVLGAFGSQVTVFCGGMMVVGNALYNTGFADFIARQFRKLGLDRNQRVLVAMVTLSCCILSAFFSNTATVAIFIPLIAIIAARSQGRIKMPLVLMGAGIGAAVGGIATLTGSTSQLVTQGILIKTAGTEPMGMFTLSVIGAPLIIVTVVYMSTLGFAIGRRVLDFEPPADLSNYDENTEIQSSSEPVAKWQLPFSMIVLLAMIAAFAVGLWDLAIVALIGAILMIATGCISLNEAIKGIDWNTLIIVSGAVAFGNGLTNSGGGQLIADSVMGVLGDSASPLFVLGVLAVLAMVMTNFASNMALVAMFVPIAITIANAFGVNPTSWAVVITLACNLAIATPVGTPAMTQTMVVGFRYMDYVKIGGPLALILTACLIILAPIAYPF